MNEYDDMYEYNDEDGGIQFQPYEDELINEYLIPKLEGKPRGEITTKDVYSKEPWLLDHPMGSFFKKNEWYYFVTRNQLSKKKIGCGKKAKRLIIRDNDSGSWKANSKGVITDKEKKKIIGKKQNLTFHKSKVNNKKKQKMGDGTSCDVVAPGSESSWIMTEYMLPDVEDKFRELVICKIHVIENSNKKKGDGRLEASTSSYHHRIDSSTSEQQPMNIVNQETFIAPNLEQQTINIVDQETFVSPLLEQQHPINEPHRHEASTYLHHFDSSTSEQQPMNIVDHGTLPAPLFEQQPINIINQETFLATNLEQLTINVVDQETFLSPLLEQQPMNSFYHPFLEQQPMNSFYHPCLEQHPMNLYDDQSVLASFSSFVQHPTNVTCKIQQNNKKDGLEVFIVPHHYEFLADSSAKQQPVNEAHGHVPEIPLIRSENNDQVFEESRQVSEKDEQLYIDAPIEEEGGDWVKRFTNRLVTMNTSSMPMEEDVPMIYDTSLIDQDLLDQYATLRPQEWSEFKESEQ